MPTVTAIILTYNESHHIADCIATLGFADAIVVFDSGSSDDTCARAAAAGARVLIHPFANYAAQRNAALEAVAGTTDWVLFIDADERATPALGDAIAQALITHDHTAYRLPRDNYIFGRLTRGAGWFPDYQTRLLRVGRSRFDPDRPVHETVITDGSLGTIDIPLIHYNYKSLSQFFVKQRRYATYDAEMLYAQGIRPKPHQYLTHPLHHFRWRFVTLKGYGDGWHGLRLSLLMARYEYQKYQRLRQLIRAGATPPRSSDPGGGGAV